MAPFDDHSGKIVSAAIAAVGATVTWLVRTILTNNRRVDLLEQKTGLQHSETIRRIEEIKTSNDAALHKQSEMHDMLRKISER